MLHSLSVGFNEAGRAHHLARGVQEAFLVGVDWALTSLSFSLVRDHVDLGSHEDRTVDKVIALCAHDCSIHPQDSTDHFR